jgi:hypothetical protein
VSTPFAPLLPSSEHHIMIRAMVVFRPRPDIGPLRVESISLTNLTHRRDPCVRRQFHDHVPPDLSRRNRCISIFTFCNIVGNDIPALGSHIASTLSRRSCLGARRGQRQGLPVVARDIPPTIRYAGVRTIAANPIET